MVLPCPNCGCAQCSIATDNFNRSDSTSLGSSWTEVLTDAEISSNALLLTNARALVVHTTNHPDAVAGVGGNSRISVVVTPNTGGGDIESRVIVAYEDSDNYLFAAYFEGDTECPWFRLGKRDGGSESWLTEERPLDTLSTSRTMYVCWEHGTLLSAHIGNGAGWPDKVYLEAEVTNGPEGDQVGLEFSAGAGSVKFDDFDWQRHKSDSQTTCPECLAPCLVFEDASPSDDCHWDDESGILVGNHFNPQNDLGTRIEVTATPDTSTSTIYLYVDWVDANNHHRISLVSNGTNGTLQIHRVAGGTPTQVGTTLNVTGYTGGEVTIQVCITPPTSIIATVLGFQRAVVSNHHGGIYWGLGGSATFENFAAYSLAEECDDCDQILSSCNTCESGTVPSVIAVKFSGVVSDRCDAANLNDIWLIAPYVGCTSGPQTDWCLTGESNDTNTVTYSVNPPSSIRDACDPATAPNGGLINFISLFINIYGITGTDDWRIHVRAVLQSAPDQDTPVFNGIWINQSTPPDCRLIEGVVIPFTCDWIVVDPPTGVDPVESYDFTNATVTVSVP